MLKYLRHWEFLGKNPNESVFVSESTQPDTVVIRLSKENTTTAVKLTEDQFRAIATLIGYSPDCIQFQQEQEQEPTNEL